MSKNNSGDGCLVLLLILGAISLILQAIGVAIKITIIVALSILGLIITYKLIRAIYHLLNPEAKKAFIAKKSREAEEWKKQIKREEAEGKAKKKRELADRKATWDLQVAVAKTRWEKKERQNVEKQTKDFERQQHRDKDQQDIPYTYKIGNHGNESLAIRYGIANQEIKLKEHCNYAKGDMDKIYAEPVSTIRLQKTKKVGKDLYEVLLTDFRDRKGRAIIELGTEYVKTFYPLKDSWFEKYANLEETLKGNNSFTLKELATFHVQKSVDPQ